MVYFFLTLEAGHGSEHSAAFSLALLPESAAVFLSRHKGDFPERAKKLFETFAVDAEPDEHRAFLALLTELTGL